MCSGAVLAQIIAGAGSYSEVVRFPSGENYPAIEPKAHISFRLFRPMLAAVMRWMYSVCMRINLVVWMSSRSIKASFTFSRINQGLRSAYFLRAYTVAL